MTLKFRSLDMNAPGSHKVRKKALTIILAFRQAGLKEDPEALERVEGEVEALLKEFAYTEDGSSVDEAFDKISEIEYQGAIASLFGQGFSDPS